jgi:hypothetical protein
MVFCVNVNFVACVDFFQNCDVHILLTVVGQVFFRDTVIKINISKKLQK